MHERQQRVVMDYEHLLRHFEKYPIVPEPPLLAGKRRQLADTLERIKACENIQAKAPVHEFSNLEFRRKDLRERRMLPLRHLAKGELLFAPGSEAALRVPHARASARAVSAAAVRMADALMPHVKVLRAAGVSKDFLLQMRQEAHALALSLKQNAEKRKRRTEATATIASEIRKARSIVATLDGLVMLNATAEAQKEWRGARRPSKKVGRPRKVRRRKSRPDVS